MASAPAVASYAYVGGANGEIQVFALDRISGQLDAQGAVSAGRAPSALAADRRGRFLYAAGGGSAEVAAFAIRGRNGALTSLGRGATRGAGTNDIAVHRSGKYVLASNGGSGTAVVLPVKNDGHFATGDVFAVGAGPQAIACHPTGESVFVLSGGTRSITQFVFNTGTGILTPSRETSPSLPARGTTSRIVFHPSGRYAYVLEEGQGVIAGYAFEATSGTLSTLAFQTIPVAPTEATAKAAKAPKISGGDLQVAPSGRFLYATARGHDLIAVYAIDAESGGLTLLRHDDSHGHQPRALALVEGKLNPFLLVAHQGSTTLTAFHVDPTTGALTHASTVRLRAAPVSLLAVTATVDDKSL